MKNEKHKKWLGLFVLFLEFFGDPGKFCVIDVK